jgi:predicted dehydrogenase
MLRFGIAGFGLHAVKRLMPGFQQSTRTRVTALSRRNLDEARASAKQYGIPHVFDSVKALAASPDVGAVFVTSPDALHRDHTLAALDAGKHVLCEKPMAMNATEAREMVDAAERANRRLGVAQVFRFEESVNLARSIVRSADLGAVREASIEFHYSGLGSPRKWIADDSLACGGPIADVGVHCIDALRYILGEEPVSVQTQARRDEYSGSLDCEAQLELRCRSGAVWRVRVSARQEYRTSLAITGADGSIEAQDALNVERPITIHVRTPHESRKISASNHAAYARQVDAFAAWVEDGAAFPSDGENGWRNQVILDAAYRSWRTGSSEDIDFTR